MKNKTHYINKVIKPHCENFYHYNETPQLRASLSHCLFISTVYVCSFDIGLYSIIWKFYIWMGWYQLFGRWNVFLVIISIVTISIYHHQID